MLPRDAGQLYFRDEIGNVSTSIVRRLRDKTEVRLQPRFPLLGGWQVSTELQEPLSCASGTPWPSLSLQVQSTARHLKWLDIETMHCLQLQILAC